MPTWNFSLILSIFDFECKILDQNATINGRDIINTSVKVKIMKNGKYLTYPKIDREQTWNFSSLLLMFDFKCKIIHQYVVINGSKVINTRDKVWIVQNGQYLTYPKIDREETWNFPSVLSIFNFKCKIINQNVVINGSDITDTSDKVWIVQNGKYLTYPKIDREQT